MKKVLYIIPFHLGDNAPSVRVKVISDLFSLVGFSVEIASVSTAPITHESAPPLNGYVLHADQSLSLDRYQVVSKLCEKVTSKRAIEYCKKLIADIRPEIVVTYGCSFELQDALLIECGRLGIILMADETDWFDAKPSIDIESYFSSRSKERRLTKLDPNISGVISISPYLHSCFLESGAKSFYLPSVVSPFPEPHLRCSERPSLSLVYAGSPGNNKDLIAPLLQGFASASAVLPGVLKLDVVGLDAKDIRQMTGFDISLVDGIFAHGRLPHDEAVSFVAEADFGVLLRKNERYAKAGFSTKFSECMSLGTAMICNSVGGADAVLQDGIDGIVLQDADSGTLEQCLLRLARGKREYVDSLKKNAYLKARSLFMLNRYVASFEEYLDSLALPIKGARSLIG